MWCRCRCAAPGRALRSKYKAELRQPGAERKACPDWTPAPWETRNGRQKWPNEIVGYTSVIHSDSRANEFTSTVNRLYNDIRRHHSYPFAFINLLPTCWHTPLQTSLHKAHSVRAGKRKPHDSFFFIYICGKSFLVQCLLVIVTEWWVIVSNRNLLRKSVCVLNPLQSV